MSRSFLLCLFSLCITIFIACRSGKQSSAGATRLVVAPGAQPVLVSKQFSFTEGPAVDKAGNIFFTDQPNDKIWKYDTEGKLTLFLDKTGRANGLYFDRHGNIIACADASNELWSITPDGKATILMDNYEGKKMNGPNDLWVDKKNGIYFTDPYYQRDYWTRKAPELDKMQVYYLAPGSKTPVMVADSFARPNGIVGSKDGKTMYVADIGAGKIYRYAVTKDNRLTDRTLFASQTADGITLDSEGNLYAAGNGITVYNPKGEKIHHIPIPEKWTANLCFGGPKRDVLFITASTAVYTLQMQAKGIE